MQEREAGWKGSKPQKVADNRRQGGRRSAGGRQRKRESWREKKILDVDT